MDFKVTGSLSGVMHENGDVLTLDTNQGIFSGTGTFSSGSGFHAVLFDDDCIYVGIDGMKAVYENVLLQGQQIWMGTLSPIPEPGVLPLLLIGAAVLARKVRNAAK